MKDQQMNPLKRRSWSPYVVGVALGVLSWLAFATADRGLGITTAFENTAALIERAVLPQSAEPDQYFIAKEKENRTPKINWEWMLVIGVFVGAYISSRISQDRTKERVPGLWAWRFGPSVRKRYIGAFLGGALMMFGARMAGGCTSGHGITGTLQLALSSWIFVFVLFATGIATAWFIFGRGGKAHV